MNQILRTLFTKFAVAYFENIMVSSASEEEHGGHLLEVLLVLQENINHKKSCICLKKLYVGDDDFKKIRHAC